MTNTFGLNRTLGGAIGLIALVSLSSSGILLTTLNELETATSARGRSEQIFRELDEFQTAMLNQETGLRGYLLTGSETSLEPYRDGVQAFGNAIAQLRQLVGDNAIESERLVEAEAAGRDWQTTVAEPVIRDMADPATRDRARTVESSGEGKRHFDRFRDRLDAIQSEEEQALARQNAVLARAQQRATVALWISTLTILLICAGIGFAINRLITQPLVRLADAMRRLAQRDLDAEVPNIRQHNEVGEMARAVAVFKSSLIELDRTSLLRVTADTLPALVGYVDTSRHVGFLNSEFGRWFDLKVADVSEVYGQPLAQVFASESFPGAARELGAALGGVETHFEHRLVQRGSARRELEAIYRPHHAPDGSVLGVVTLLTDITERKKLDRRLAQQARDLLRSNEELEQFAYVASHDLKAPLRGIENLVSWIEEDLEETLTGDTRTNMDLLKSRVRRLESLLDDLLAYSRAGRTSESIELVDTRVLVEELAILISPPDGFSVVADATLPTIQAERAPLTQTLQNLIGNAIKHHDQPEDGSVRVEAQILTDAVEFTVTDNGPGIPARFHDRVFGMFQTLRPRDEVEGSGMGLAVVKKIVDRQGGRIWLTEGREGRGLAVHLTWPNSLRGLGDGTDGQFAAG